MGLSNGHVTDYVTWPWKVKIVTGPICLERNISKTAGFRDSVLKDHQMKSECPAAEPSVISESTIHCGVKKAPNSFQKWEIRLRQKCTNMHYFHTKNQKNLGGGRHSRGGHPLPRPYPFGACGASTLARPYSEIQSTSAPEWWGWGGERNCFGDWFGNITGSFKF